MFSSKKSVLVLALVLVFTLVAVAGCGGGEKAADNGGKGEDQPQLRDLVFGSGGAGGSWYLLAAQTSELGKEIMSDLPITVIEGGAISNVRQVNEGVDLDVGIASLPNVIDALEHRGTFAEDNIDNVAPIMNFAKDYVQFTVLANSGIDSMTDLKDKTILPGPKGWGIEALTQQVLAMYDLDYDKIKNNGGGVSFVTWGEAPSLLKDGHAQMAAFKGAIPISNIMEIEATNKAKILALDEDKIEKFVAEHPGYSKGTVPAGSYKGQTEDANTLAHTSVIFARKNLPEQIVYDLTKTLIENREKLNAIEGVEITESPLEGIDPEILHPGAKRYFEEQGIL